MQLVQVSMNNVARMPSVNSRVGPI